MPKSYLEPHEINELKKLKTSLSSGDRKSRPPEPTIATPFDDSANLQIASSPKNDRDLGKAVTNKRQKTPTEEKDQFNLYLPVSMIDKLDSLRMDGVKRARKAPSWAEVMQRLIDAYEEKHGEIKVNW